MDAKYLIFGATGSIGSNLADQLKKELSIHGKGMTAAFPSETKFSQISDQALAVFDFINIMVYDYTGSWNPSQPGQHSSYNHAQRGINFWKNTIYKLRVKGQLKILLIFHIIYPALHTIVIQS